MDANKNTRKKENGRGLIDAKKLQEKDPIFFPFVFSFLNTIFLVWFRVLINRNQTSIPNA